jgi:hypothetical protein
MTANLTSCLLQFAVLLPGIALFIMNRYWNKGPAIDASEIFFINLFWITMVLTGGFMSFHRASVIYIR